MRQIAFSSSLKFKAGKSTKQAILPTWYHIVKTLLKNNFGYEFLSKITAYEASHFYAELTNDLMFERYLQNIPTDPKGKTIQYKNDIFSI
jgi:hypothetical protein